MEQLNQKIHHLFYYDETKKVYVRHNRDMTKSNMYAEFLYIFETQYGKFIEEDWEPEFLHEGEYDIYHPYSEEAGDSENRICVCTHHIHNLYYITHKHSQMTFQVGSKCVMKCGENIAEKMKTVIVKLKNFEKGNICIYCDEPLTDNRRTYQKHGFCDYSCYQKMKYIIPFGKHKGKLLVEFICTKDGINYIDNYINLERMKDVHAFRRYPMFLEIIDETILSLEDE